MLSDHALYINWSNAGVKAAQVEAAAGKAATEDQVRAMEERLEAQVKVQLQARVGPSVAY